MLFDRRRFAVIGFCFAIISSLLTGAAVSAGAVEVLTQHEDNMRTGANLSETALTPATVSGGSFGLLFKLTLDANVASQALYMPGVTINGVVHNVIFMETNGNKLSSPTSVYAWDADDCNQTAPLWQIQFPASAKWMTANPCIDDATGTLYALTKDSTDNLAWLHAIDITSGAEKPGSPVQITGSVPGVGDGTSGGIVTFDPSQHNSRPGLLFANGNVYIAWSHGYDERPYHGWVFAYHYDGAQFTQTGLFCTTPNGGLGGVWMANKGIVGDANGNIYFATGNGAETMINGGTDYAMCYIKMNGTTMQVEDWFAPYDSVAQAGKDRDLGCAGLLMIPGTSLLMGGVNKDGSAFLMDSNQMGGYSKAGPDKIVARLNGLNESIEEGQNFVCWDAGASKYLYTCSKNCVLDQLQYDTTVSNLNPHGVYETTTSHLPGAQLCVSANGSTDGIVWADCYNGILRAYDATNVSNPELWDSNMVVGRDKLGKTGHWQFPMVADGRVYVPNGLSQLLVYGIRNPVTTPTITPANAAPKKPISVTLADTTQNAAIYYTTDGTTPTVSSTPYGGPFLLSQTATVKAIAVLSGMVNSAIAVKKYTFSP